MTRTMAAVLILLGSLTTASAQDSFRTLIDLVPRSANAVIILNLAKAKDSPLGVREGWQNKLENAFESGVTRVPPEASRFVLATQLDFETKHPLWEVAILDLQQPVSIATIAQKRKREAETLDKLPALALATNAYLVQFGPAMLGAMAPANRQAVLRWVREVQSPGRVPLSAYLQQAAGYSDEAGTEIIMAIDLDGVFSLERTVHYLKGKPDQLQQWKADLRQLTKLISNVQGLRLGVRIGDKPYGKVTVDFRDEVTAIAAFAKPLFLEILDDAGAVVKTHRFSERFDCRACGIAYEIPQPRLFSFNNPFGACPTCHGFGNTIELDMNLVVPDQDLSINGGAVASSMTCFMRAAE